MSKSAFFHAAVLTIAFLAMFVAQDAPAAPTFSVNSILDQPDDLTMPGTCHTAAGTCTLRAAVMQANRTSGVGATIILPAGPPYILTIPAAGADDETNGDLNLTAPANGNPVITITGSGAATTIIDANQLDRVIHVHAGRSVVISGVTIRNGYFTGGNAYGGGIYSEGVLTVDHVAITGNHAEYGGGINNGNNLIVTNSTISQNVADTSGGGIYNAGSPIPDAINAAIINSTISLNTASSGGGIVNGGNMRLSYSTISGNGAYDGGGIWTGGTNLFVVDSTISQNYATNNGGGIAKTASNGLAAIYNASVIENDADHDRDPGAGIGGGVYSEASARFIVVNSILARNTILNSPTYDDCNGVLEVYGWNLLGDETGCSFTGNGTASRGFVSLTSIGPLQNNGGPTWTHALLPGSAAIDATFDALGCVDDVGALLTIDQRGAPRIAGVRCDVGAYEYNPLAPPAQVSAASRKVHGAAGSFDLPLGGVLTNPTTEPRQGPAQTIVLTFDKAINAATATISEGTAMAGAPTFSGNDVIVGLTGVTNQQYVTISLTGVASSDGSSGGAGSARVGFLAGDVNQTRVVTVADLGLVNAQLAQPVTASNYLKDVNASGTLTVADKGITNTHLTQALPPP